MDEVYFEKARSSKNKNNNNKPFFDGEIQIGTHTEATLPVYICADRSKQTPKKPQS